MLGSLFFKGLIDSRYVIASSVLGIASYLACELLLNLSFDSIFIGLSVGFIIFVLGALKKQKA